jgi:hypothetical protein
MKPFGVTGENLDVKERQYVKCMLGESKFHYSFLVCPPPMEVGGLLGTGFLTESGAIIDLSVTQCLLLKSMRCPEKMV